MKFNSDIDIDFADRAQILKLLKHVPASIIKQEKLSKHNTGVYFTNIPIDPFTGQSSLDYGQAESRGYLKLDFLNVNLYQKVKNEQHLIELANKDPDWSKLYIKSFCEQLIHIGSHYDSLIKMPDTVDSIIKMAMFLALIRPAKRHLIGKKWSQVVDTIWEKDADSGYQFKKSHAIAYAHLVVVNMNLLNHPADQSN